MSNVAIIKYIKKEKELEIVFSFSENRIEEIYLDKTLGINYEFPKANLNFSKEILFFNFFHFNIRVFNIKYFLANLRYYF